IAMTANVARVVLTGYIMRVNPEYASGAYHTAEGLLMMGLGLALLRAECWVMDQLIALAAPSAPPVVPPAPHASGRVETAAPLPNLIPADDRRPLQTCRSEMLDGLSRNEQGRLLEQGWTI